MAEIAPQHQTLPPSEDFHDETRDNIHGDLNSPSQNPPTPAGNEDLMSDLPSELMSDAQAITRPTTPPESTSVVVPRTPRTPRPDANATPRTPRSNGGGPAPYTASAYLSSPIRRSRHHASLLASGAMTPGRPSLKYGFMSPVRASRPLGGLPEPPPSSSSPSNAGTSPVLRPGVSLDRLGGRVQFDSGSDVMPLQTLLITPEQVAEIKDLGRARELLVLAIEQSERFRTAAQQFRSQASNLAFQHKLVQLERDETQQRYEVEASIQQREIQKLVTDIMGYSGHIGTEQISRKLRRTKNRLKEMEELLVLKDGQIAELQEQLSRQDRPRPPPIDTALASASRSAPGSASEPLSALEVLASQVLSSGIQRQEPFQTFYTPFSPFAMPPMARQSPTSHPQFGSPEKRRRPSSSSTISMSEDDTLEEVLE